MRRVAETPSRTTAVYAVPSLSSKLWLICMLLILALPLPPVASAAGPVHFFVATNGSRYWDGSIERPWDLATALAHPAVRSGATIWLRGGTYRGPFVSWLTGSRDAPITVRQYPGERAILDSVGSGEPTLAVFGSWTTYWGFEVMNSHPQRVALDWGQAGIVRGNGVQVRAPGTKFINMIVHDTRDGFGFWAEAPDAELYGNLSFFNGYVGRPSGHGIYAQNSTGSKRIVDNIVFQNFSHGIHAYSEVPGKLNNLHVEGNIVFNNGEPSGTFARNILVGGISGVVAQNPTIRNNYTYYPSSPGGGQNNLGYVGGCNNPTVQDNHFVGSVVLALVRCANTFMTGNTFYGRLGGFTPATFPANTYFTARPTGVEILVRPNQYEAGRAHIVVYNWDRLGSVGVDVSRILRVGAVYEVRNVQDYFGRPVLAGRYDGRPLRVPMAGLRVAAPVGSIPGRLTTAAREFAAFVLVQGR